MRRVHAMPTCWMRVYLLQPPPLKQDYASASMAKLPAPEGPRRVARVVRPWWTRRVLREAPEGRHGRSPAPPMSPLTGLGSSTTANFQGLAPLATRLGPSGAASRCIILSRGRGPEVFSICYPTTCDTKISSRDNAASATTVAPRASAARRSCWLSPLQRYVHSAPSPE
jgi:hypothetical protein